MNTHPTHSNQMKIVSIAFVVLIAVLFFLSQKPQQSPRAQQTGGGSTTNVTVSCPTGTTVSENPSCIGSNLCMITCSPGGGDQSFGGDCELAKDEDGFRIKCTPSGSDCPSGYDCRAMHKEITRFFCAKGPACIDSCPLCR